MDGGFLPVFLTFFAAVDAIGLLPAFTSMTEGLDASRRRRVILQSLVVAAAVSLVFLTTGPRILGWLGVSVSDFTVAGGLLLLALSLHDQFASGDKPRTWDVETMGAVPLGVPLLVGPGVLAACVLLQAKSGFAVSFLALGLNLLLAGALFLAAPRVLSLLGRTGVTVLSRLSSLLLTAISVMLLRRGIEMWLAGR